MPAASFWSRLRRPQCAAFWVVTLLYLGIWWRDGGPHPSATPLGYYGYMTEGLAHGHLHMMAEPDPRLAKLANPWAAYQGIPRMHDATYFHGHYYLYFGVAPIILLFGPWHALFGSYLSEGTAAFVFAYVGFLAGLSLLRAWRRGQPLGSGWEAFGILVWGLSTYVIVDMEGAQFYEVPILCAFMCVTLALAAVMRSVQAGTAGRAAGWLALASLAWGTAVASRPHYVLSLPCLVVPFAWLVWRWRSWGSAVTLALASLIPAGTVGAGIAWYNHARFGSISEFGFRYQFTASDQRFIQVWNPGLILPNLHSYCLQGTLYTVFFPFVTPTADMVGILAWTPIAGLALLLPLALLGSPQRKTPEWTIVLLCTLGAGLIHLLALSILPIGTNRYDVDFDPEFVLCALAVGAWFLASRGRLGPLAARLGSVVLALLAGISVAKDSLLSLQRTSAPVYRTAAEIGNGLVSLLHLPGTDAAGVSFRANLSSIPAHRDTPLVVTGSGGDRVFARRVDPQRIQVGFFHAGNVAVLSAPFVPKIEPVLIAVEMGSLCPPDTAPPLRHWDSDILELLEHRVLVTVDGQTQLLTHSNFYASDPFHVRLGAEAGQPDGAAIEGGVSEKAFIPLPAPEKLLADGWRGPVRLHLRFPPYSVDFSEPLISSGRLGAADMIYVTYLGPGLARFGHDSNRFGGMESDPVRFDPAAEHTLDVDLGALDVAGQTGEIPSNLGMRFDGKWILNSARPSHPTMPAQVSFGYNSGRMSTAQETFSGPELYPEPIAKFSQRTKEIDGNGPLELSVQFLPMPYNTIGTLLSTGVPGKGDIYIVRYLNPNQIELRLDHWGIGEVTSAPISIEANRIYSFEISAATFLPKDDDPLWNGVPQDERLAALSRIEIKLNGKVVLTAPWVGYPAARSEVHVGANPLGGSMEASSFPGTVIEAHRMWAEGGYGRAQ